MKKRGFTLAEVLITLGIIGVVAAMTMPTLIANHKKKEMVTKTQYVYSVVSQVLVKSQSENGEAKEWNFGGAVSTQGVKDAVEKYFAPYIEHIGEGSSANGTYYLVLKNGITITFQFDVAVAGGPPVIIYVIASFKGNTSPYYAASRDYSKSDLFLTIFPGRNKLTFFNWGGETRESIINEPSYGCRKELPKYRRYSCGALIQSDGWQIKEDYPW